MVARSSWSYFRCHSTLSAKALTCVVSCRANDKVLSQLGQGLDPVLDILPFFLDQGCADRLYRSVVQSICKLLYSINYASGSPGRGVVSPPEDSPPAGGAAWSVVPPPLAPAPASRRTVAGTAVRISGCAAASATGAASVRSVVVPPFGSVIAAGTASVRVSRCAAGIRSCGRCRRQCQSPLPPPTSGSADTSPPEASSHR